MQEETIEPVHRDWNSEVQKAFLSTARCAVELQNKLMLHLPGRLSTYLIDFRKTFNYLYLVTPDKRDLDKDIVEKTKTWLMTEQPDPLEGIKLFEDYRVMLNMNNLIGGSCRH